ncbi:YrbL family protein [Falsirhodobacter algicola]|uniref:PhoP regulatory network protein YrbL n=1 Tax=Falsirhodobacter algicola TaxID=2692330 RepID=A0A8J8SM83_9RHOB|nr:YrbL family protein [Falsirhodobacter algicola]QUS37184.1 hypothetical protein GR316_12460 [Falsirhodobacter algicola]
MTLLSDPTEQSRLYQQDAWFVRLAANNPIAEGRESKVYSRPGKPSQLVKVRKYRQAKNFGVLKRLKNAVRRRFGISPDTYNYHKNIRRQYQAYLDASLRVETLRRPPPIAHLRGLLLTDVGFSIVVQKIRNEDGDIAPTVGEIVSKKLMDAAQLADLLTEFARDMRAFHILGYDLTLNNLLYETRHGRSRIVLIDGYGPRSMIPLRSWSRRLNDTCLAEQFAIMAPKIGCVWDAGIWGFRPAGHASAPP